MSVYHDEVEIEDFEYDEDEEVYYYPCPCGDQFQISKAELAAGVEEATCPSCSLIIKVIYDKEAFAAKQEELIRDEEKQLVIQKYKPSPLNVIPKCYSKNELSAKVKEKIRRIHMNIT
ncbi:unnamed protein product [Heterotrigona itama]|uniref:Diphthamide biosynthesis protein 3 n=1 Tax=Heterotrigona itama TaxID=395501 RepID=A0A6V7HJP9_9HYME|nr:unnamed protein product [Heterotrigona itama]